jgi:hypothetical protein
MHALLLTLALVPGADKGELPVSLGEYQYFIGGKRIGEEQFRVFKKDGYRFESTRTLYYPEPSRQEIRYELEPSFEPKNSMMTTRAGSLWIWLPARRTGERRKGQGRDRRSRVGRERRPGGLRLADLQRPGPEALAPPRGGPERRGGHPRPSGLAGARPTRPIVGSTTKRSRRSSREARRGGLRCRGDRKHRLWVIPPGSS